MAEEVRYRKIRTKGNPIVFNCKERWIQMNDLSDGTYYVSDFGRIARLNPQGIFHEIKQSYWSKNYYVSIEEEGKNRKIHIRKRVGKLVLKYFVGGCSGRRRYIHLNGEKSDCSLKNLRWRKGFIDDVDLVYLRKLNTSKMSTESAIVSEFLKTEDCAELFKMLYGYTPLLKYIDFRLNTKYLKNNDIESFFINVIDKLKAGEFKPNIKHKQIITFKTFLMNSFRESCYRYRTIREFSLAGRWQEDNLHHVNFDDIDEHLKTAI